eukprot:3345261-Amphidinium_carterae.1
MNAAANLPHLAEGLKLELTQKHDADTTTNEPIPGFATVPIAPRLKRDDDEMTDLRVPPRTMTSPEEIAAEATAAAAAEIPPLETEMINKALASTSAVKCVQSCPAQLRNPTPLAVVRESASDSSYGSAESHTADSACPTD